MPRNRGQRRYLQVSKFLDLGAGLRGDDAVRVGERHGYQTADAAFGHCDAEKPIHAGHGQRMVRDDEVAGFGNPAHLVEQTAEAVNIGVIKRRIDLIEHTDRRRVDQENGEDQRDGGERLLAAG